MNQDEWQRTPMGNLEDFFNLSVMLGKLPVSYSKYNILLNKGEDLPAEQVRELIKELEYSNWLGFKETHEGQIFSKTIKNDAFIISNSSFEVLKFAFENLKYMKLFNKTSFHCFNFIFEMLDFFVFSIMRCQNDKSLLREILKKPFEKPLEEAFENYCLKSRFSELRRLTERVLGNFDEEIEVDDLCNDYRMSGLFPSLTGMLSGSNAFIEMFAGVIMYESVRGLAKFMKRVKYFTDLIEDPEKRKIVENKYLEYSAVIGELKEFVYLPVTKRVLNLEGDLSNISSLNWDSESEKLVEMEECEMCYNIRQNLKYIYDKLGLLSCSGLEESHKMRFMTVCFTKVTDEMIEAFSKCKKAGLNGQVAMLKEAKSLVENVRYTFQAYQKLNTNETFERLVNFLSLWNESFNSATESLINGNYPIKAGENLLKNHPESTKTLLQAGEDSIRVQS